MTTSTETPRTAEPALRTELVQHRGSLPRWSMPGAFVVALVVAVALIRATALNGVVVVVAAAVGATVVVVAASRAVE